LFKYISKTKLNFKNFKSLFEIAFDRLKNAFNTKKNLFKEKKYLFGKKLKALLIVQKA
jgi:hypothetical protein